MQEHKVALCQACFRGLSYSKPAKSSSYLNVNIFGTMHRKLNDLWTSIGTGLLCVCAKFHYTIMHNQGDKAF